MLILAIDTATEQAGIALAEDDRLRAEWSWTSAGNHSSHLQKLVPALLETERVQARALDAVVAARGPGSFSGLRVGISFAKGLALALDVPLVGVGTLDLIAQQGIVLSTAVLAVIPAGRGMLFVGQFRGTDDRLERTAEDTVLAPEEVAALVGPDTWLCGSGADAVTAVLTAQGVEWRQEPPVLRLRRPGYLAELGRRKLAEGAKNEVDSLEPAYMRRSAAEEARLARQE